MRLFIFYLMGVNYRSLILALLLPFLLTGYTYEEKMINSSLKKFNKALVNVRSGTSNAVILCLGDSGTIGVGSNNTGGGTGAGDIKQGSYPTLLAKLLNSMNLPATWQSFFGDGNGTYGAVGINSLNDARIVRGASWGRASDQLSIAGYPFESANATNAMTFTPTEDVDTLVAYYRRYAGGGTLSLDRGGSPVTQSTSGTEGIGTLTLSGTTLGKDAFNIKQTTGAAVKLLGVRAYNSLKESIEVINAGWSGSPINQLVDDATASSPLNAIEAIAPSLVIIDIGTNDQNNGTDIADFITDYQKLIDEVKTYADIVLVTPIPINPSMVAVNDQLPYVLAVRELARSNDLMLIDQYEMLESYAESASYYYNNWHLNVLGYWFRAYLVIDSLFGWAGSGTDISGVSSVTESGISLSDNIINDVSTAKHGFVPKLPNDSSKFLNGDGTFSQPPGGGTGAQQTTGSWTPSDGSAASLTLTYDSGNFRYVKIGNMVHCTFSITYPSNSDGNAAKIDGLPFTVSTETTNWVWGGYCSLHNLAQEITILAANNGTKFEFYKNSGAQITNAQLSGKTLRGMVTYEAA